jgi:hypothetical protein
MRMWKTFKKNKEWEKVNIDLGDREWEEDDLEKILFL